MLMSFFLVGCQAAHIYNQSKDTLAAGIKERFDKENPKKVLDTHKENLKKLSATEREVSAESVLFKRDVVIWHLANGRRTGDFSESDKSENLTLGVQLLPNFTDPCSEGCQSYATVRMKELGIKSDENIKTAVNEMTERGTGSLIDEPGTLILQKEQTDRDTKALKEVSGWKDIWDCPKVLDTYKENLKKFPREPEPESDNRAVNATSDEAAKAANIASSSGPAFNGTFSSYLRDCQNYLKDENVPDFFQADGKIAVVFKEWIADQQSVELLNEARGDAINKLKDLKGSFPSTNGEMDNKSFIDKAQQDAESIANLLNEAKKAKKIVKGIGLEDVFAKARLDDLGFLLKAVHAGTLDGLSEEELKKLKDDSDFYRAAVLAAGLPGLGNKVESLIKLLGRTEARTDLLIQFAYQKARVDYLKKRARLIEERAGLRQSLLRSLLREVFLLDRAKQFVEPSNLAAKTLSAVLEGSDTLDKERLYQSLIAFDHAISVARKRSAEIRSELANFGRWEGVLADEYAMDAWSALLKGSIDQLVAFHKAGIKPETVGEALAGLASLGLLGAIAVGTN